MNTLPAAQMSASALGGVWTGWKCTKDDVGPWCKCGSYHIRMYVTVGGDRLCLLLWHVVMPPIARGQTWLCLPLPVSTVRNTGRNISNSNYRRLSMKKNYIFRFWSAPVVTALHLNHHRPNMQYAVFRLGDWLTLWLPAVFGDEPVSGQRFLLKVAYFWTTVIINWLNQTIIALYQNNGEHFLLSNCIAHHAMWTYVVRNMYKTHIPSQSRKSPSLAGKRWALKDGYLRLWQSKC